jgi:hypothetical protein
VLNVYVEGSKEIRYLINGELLPHSCSVLYRKRYKPTGKLTAFRQK